MHNKCLAFAEAISPFQFSTLVKYVMGGLDQNTSKKVEQHLESCQTCRLAAQYYWEIMELPKNVA